MAGERNKQANNTKRDALIELTLCTRVTSTSRIPPDWETLMRSWGVAGLRKLTVWQLCMGIWNNPQLVNDHLTLW
ncbi:hypothetical protein BT69DRAFT_1288379, partial [Atractiella rhizophila]